MSNIILPQASALTNTNSSTNVLTESGGSIYRTTSGNLISNAIRSLPVEVIDSLNDINFVAMDNNNELKRININGNLGGGAGVEYVEINGFDITLEPYQWTQQYLMASKSFSDIINLLESGQQIILIAVIEEAVINFSLSQGNNAVLMFSNITTVDDSFMTSIIWESDNTFWVYKTPLGPETVNDIEFYWNDGGDTTTCNYTYEELMALINSGKRIENAMVYFSEGSSLSFYAQIEGSVLQFNNIYTEVSTEQHVDQPYIRTQYIEVNSSGIWGGQEDVNGGYYETILWMNEDYGSTLGEVIISVDIRDYDMIKIVSPLTFTDEEGSWTITSDRYFQTGADIIEEGHFSVSECWDIDKYWQRDLWWGTDYLYLSYGYYHENDYIEDKADWTLMPLAIVGLKKND